VAFASSRSDQVGDQEDTDRVILELIVRLGTPKLRRDDLKSSAAGTQEHKVTRYYVHFLTVAFHNSERRERISLKKPF